MWSELSAEYELRYAGEEGFFVPKMSEISGVTKGLFGFVVWVSDRNISQEFSSACSRTGFFRLVLRPEFQSTCLAFRPPTSKTENRPPKRVVRSAPISGAKAKVKPQGFEGLSVNVRLLAVTSSWSRKK